MKLFSLEAELTLNTSGFTNGVNTSKSQMEDIKNDLGSVQEEATETGSILDSALGHAVGELMSQLTSSAIDWAVDFAQGSVDAAASMESTNRRISKVFGDMAGDLQTWSATTKTQYGISEAAAKSYASRIGALLSSDTLGFSTEEIYSMSTALTGLAGDLASLYGYSLDVTFEKIISGLRGETEAIEDLGVDMRASVLAASLDITEGEWGKLDQRTRTLAMFEHIMNSTTVAQGNFADTQDTYAAQIQLFNSNLQELQTTLGAALLPALTDLVTWMNSLFGAGEDGAEAIKDMGTELGQTYATIDNTATNALALVNALKEMEAAGVDTADEQGVWNQLLKELASTLPEISGLIDTTTGSINGGTDALKAYVQQWQESQREMATARALQAMQTEIAEQATKVSTLQFQLSGAQMTDDEAEQKWWDLIFLAAEHYFPETDEVDYMQVVSKLEKQQKNGDVYAEWILGQIANLEDREENLTNLEQQLLAAQAELEAMNVRYMQVQSQVDAILNEFKGEETKSGPTQGETYQPQPLNITLNVTLDGQDISASLVPSVTGAVMGAIDWQLQTKAGG